MAKRSSKKVEQHQIPTRFSTRLVIGDAPKSTSRRRKPTPEAGEPRVLSEAELREQAAWKQVEESGKPMQLGDTLLIPEGMSPWKAVEFLPDEAREQTQAMMQRKIGEVYFNLVQHKRSQILEKAAENSEWAQYKTFPYGAQMAIADSVLRQEFDLPEIAITELIKQYGGKIEGTAEDDKGE